MKFLIGVLIGLAVSGAIANSNSEPWRFPPATSQGTDIGPIDIWPDDDLLLPSPISPESVAELIDDLLDLGQGRHSLSFLLTNHPDWTPSPDLDTEPTSDSGLPFQVTTAVTLRLCIVNHWNSRRA
jgi:hypothetical protein